MVTQHNCDAQLNIFYSYVKCCSAKCDHAEGHGTGPGAIVANKGASLREPDS
jgi:hypothetical protein